MQEIANNFITDGDKELLDYGCGNMPYRPVFEPLLGRYWGFDLEGNDLADGIIEDNGNIIKDRGSVDFVLSSQVLEHVVDPENYLGESHRVLRNNGKLILSTHGVWQFHPDPIDLWRWTCDGLRKIVTDAGFEVNFFKGMMGPEATALQILQGAKFDRIPKRLQKPYVWLMQRKMERADRKCSDEERDKDACVYALVATKID